MLTLAQSRQTDSLSIFRDFVLSEGNAVFTNIFYVLPNTPRFSRKANGAPAFDFLWYRSAAPGAAKTGGLVTMTLELSPAPDQASAVAGIIASNYGMPAGDVELRSIPFKSGSVQLAYAGGGADGEFATQIAGNGPAQLIGTERATFVVNLSADGAALLADAIDRSLRIFHLRYDLVFEHRLASVHMRVWCDVANSLKTAAALAQTGVSDPAKINASLIAKSTAGIEITSGQPLPTDQQAALQKMGQDLLNRAIGSTMFSPGDGKSAPQLLPYSPAMESSLNFTIDQSFPLEQHAALDALLEVELTPEQAAQQIRKIDLAEGFFSVLDVQVVCTVDFATDLISLVRARIDYDQTGDTGRVQRSGELVFKQGNDPTQSFRTDLAAPGKTRYSYTVDVFYQGDHPPLHLEWRDVDKTVLVLDLDSAGVLDVQVGLRDVPFDKVNSAVVDLAYPSKQLSAQLILDGRTPSGRWRSVIAEARQSWRYKVSWVLTDGRRLDVPWTDSNVSSLQLDAPAELRAKMHVELVAAGNFSDLTQIVVDIRSDQGLATQITLNAPGQTQSWEAQPGPDGTIGYQYKRTLVYKDGRNRALDSDWVLDTRPVLVIANDSTFHLQIVPKLLDLGGSLRMVILELESEPATADSVERKTLLVRTKTDPLEWSFDMDAPGNHRYRYRLTPVPVAGERPPAPDWSQSDAEILVLQLPPK